MTRADYLERAKECERMAKQVASQEQRQKILKIAAGWRELTAESEAKEAAARDPD